MVAPQEGVLSPIIFNLNLASLPDPPLNASKVSNTDNCTVYASCVNIVDISSNITD